MKDLLWIQFSDIRNWKICHCYNIGGIDKFKFFWSVKLLQTSLLNHLTFSRSGKLNQIRFSVAKNGKYFFLKRLEIFRIIEFQIFIKPYRAFELSTYRAFELQKDLLKCPRKVENIVLLVEQIVLFVFTCIWENGLLRFSQISFASLRGYLAFTAEVFGVYRHFSR